MSGLQRYECLSDPAGALRVVVLSSPRTPGALFCNGSPMHPAKPMPCSSSTYSRTSTSRAEGMSATLEDPESGLRIACLSGAGSLTFQGRPLTPLSR
jgi:hypothetical protein